MKSQQRSARVPRNDIMIIAKSSIFEISKRAVVKIINEAEWHFYIMQNTSLSPNISQLSERQARQIDMASLLTRKDFLISPT